MPRTQEVQMFGWFECLSLPRMQIGEARKALLQE